ncbi:unnamed protein product, partial [marine sediment metagenome]
MVERSCSEIDNSGRKISNPIVLVLGSAVVTFSVLSLFFVPMWDGRSSLEVISEMLSSQDVVVGMGDEPPAEPPDDPVTNPRWVSPSWS